jgi:hypothetical protein
MNDIMDFILKPMVCCMWICEGNRERTGIASAIDGE